MYKYNNNIKELKMDFEFIKKAQRVTSFNLDAKDFQSLTYKKEIQYL